MHGLKTITNDIQFLSSMDQFVSAYQELTVFQMRQRRDAIVNSRAFTNGLLDVFVDLTTFRHLICYLAKTSG